MPHTVGKHIPSVEIPMDPHLLSDLMNHPALLKAKSLLVYLCDFLIITLFLLLLYISFSEGIVVETGTLRISIRSFTNPLIIFSGISSLRIILFGIPKWCSFLFGNCFSVKEIYEIEPEKYFARLICCALFIAFFSIIAVKTFIFIVAGCSFHEIVTIRDLVVSYLPDTKLLLAATLIASVLSFSCAKNSSAFFRRAVTLMMFAILFLLVGYSFFNILSGFIYFEWGAFVESHHLLAMKQAGVRAEFVELLFRWQTVLFFLVDLFLLYLIFFLLKKSNRISIQKFYLFFFMLLAPLAVSSNFLLKNPAYLSPIASSPLLLLTAKVDDNTDGISEQLLKSDVVDEFRYQREYSLTNSEYKSLDGVAKDMNVVFFVLESVRKKSVGLYGYDRDTMPTLSRIAQNSIVFHNAYAHQPRSCKTLAALTLGVAPDPRLRALTWRSHTVADADNFLKRLLDRQYELYFGVNQTDFGGDDFRPFIENLTSKRISRAIDRQQVDAAANFNKNGDDRKLVDDFLNWSEQQQTPYVALLWTSAAHMPYLAPEVPFGQRNTIDCYDNCLFSVDLALKNLVDGLRNQNLLEKTLLVVLGDHGEAVGDKMDWGHGNYLYDHSLRIPFLIFNEKFLPARKDISTRFQVKDIPSTLLFLLGLPDDIGQSENIFFRKERSDLYFSNVYHDFKLGVIFDEYKFIYRPKYDRVTLFDLGRDPEEEKNVIGKLPPQRVKELKRQLLGWYEYQLQYLNETYPPKQVTYR